MRYKYFYTKVIEGGGWNEPAGDDAMFLKEQNMDFKKQFMHENIKYFELRGIPF